MNFWESSPAITFRRGGAEIQLGTDPDAEFLHLGGTEGLGLPVSSASRTERLSGDGSLTRGVRYNARELFIPLMLEAPTVGELTLQRRRLAALLAPHQGDIEIRVQDPATGSTRSIFARLSGGMEDGAGGADYYGEWQTLGLTFDCDDPWWLGPEQTTELRINPGSKPFISTSAPFFPVMMAQSTVQGRFTVDIQGAGPVWPVWEVLGPGEDLVIANGSDRIEVSGAFLAGAPVLFDTAEGRITPDRWANVSQRSRLFSLNPGRQTITVTLVGATTDTLVRLTYRERYLEGI